MSDKVTLSICVRKALVKNNDGTERLIVPSDAQVAFQTNTFGPKTSKAIITNFNALVKAARDPSNTKIQFGQVIYLPCMLLESRDSTGEAPLEFMDAEGSLQTVESPAASEPDEGDDL